ncbi:MAG: plasmid replication initiator TrfA [Lamprobacter sp.]|uniref:plasmid replication initiator TrfA n=1 Tax=Lamprobacter sp. TaxID=3100796 RepID=UPI002B262152|nr:plasmid replication initiator TrfA [Lamprobacter sp.]MEA3641767.1 plasmid replication initiator TrfA [Lamprobacter sp.]
MAENKRCSQDRTGRSEPKEPGLPSEDGDAKSNQAVTALQRLGKRLEQRALEVPAPPHSAKVIKLPLWPEAVRGVPNVALRSALFGAVRRGPRRLLTRELITSVDGCEIRYTGGRLDQADLDVWEHCLHLARQDGVGCRIHFTAYSFLKHIQRATGGRNVEWLKNALARLASAVVEIQHGSRAYFGPMIQHGGRDDETGQYCIEINPAIVALYGPDGWSRVDWEQRKQLKKQPLAQWLHGFYTSHAEPYAYKVETLHRLAGSETKQLKHFRADLKDALRHLAEVTGWIWQIDDRDLVHLQKTPSLPRNQPQPTPKPGSS